MEESVLQSVSIDMPVGVRVYNDIEHKITYTLAICTVCFPELFFSGNPYCFFVFCSTDKKQTADDYSDTADGFR